MPAGGDFVGCCGPNGSASCQNPSEPVATIGLCLGDGRPIAVTVVRDCEGNTTQEGWLDLTTGVWSAGPPPEGTTTCDGGRPQFEVGQWCDLDADGQTIAPVLVEYEYGPEGQLVGVRTLTPAGDPYEVEGTLGLCPGADEDGSPPEPCRDCETITLCDTIDPSPGESGAEPVVVTFLRTICRDCDSNVTSVTDTELDGTTTYEVQGQVDTCLCHPEIDLDGVTLDTGPDREFHILCDAEGVAFLRRYSVDGDGETTLFDSELDGTTPYMPVEPVGLCSTGLDPNDTSPPELCGVTQVLERTRCDDLTEESPGEVVCYTELIGVNCHGQLQPLGTFTPDLAEPYTPTNPVPCQEVSTPGDPIVGVQTQRLQLDPGQAWAATTVPLLQTVTISAHGGEGQVTTEAGVSTLFEGESVTWSVVHEYETVLRGPLTVQATSGVVTVTYTEGVTA